MQTESTFRVSEKEEMTGTSRLSEQDIKEYVLERFEEVKKGK